VIEASPAVTDDVKELALDSDQVAVPELQPTDEMTIVARLSPRSQVREGTRVDLAVDTSMLHLFDPQTGLAIR
jgi:multiple sugar transport system ATP-binding protein